MAEVRGQFWNLASTLPGSSLKHLFIHLFIYSKLVAPIGLHLVAAKSRELLLQAPREGKTEDKKPPLKTQMHANCRCLYDEVWQSGPRHDFGFRQMLCKKKKKKAR